MSNLYAASNQWATRPADERFWNLRDMQTALETDRADCYERDLRISDMQAVANGNELCLQGEAGIPVRLNNWSFGQLCNRIGAPAGYLQQLPINLALANVQHGLQNVGRSDENDAKLLLHKNGVWTARALTTPTYGRIWNSEVCESLLPVLDKGWMIPPARPNCEDVRARPATAADILPNQDDFGLSVKIGDMIAPAGCYAGDRDLFVFLVNPSRIIDDGGRGLMRGVFVQNSEVGSAAFSVRTFYLENICGNHIVWGASKVNQFRLIHKKNAVIGFDSRMMRALGDYCEASAVQDECKIFAAKQTSLGKDKAGVVASLFGIRSLQLAKRDIESAFDWAVRWEHTAHAAPNTVWGLVHGLTRYSQTSKFADDRMALDRAAGKIFDIAC